MEGNIILAGGDEFRRDCVAMDRHILSSFAKDRPRVLIVPTAAVTGPQKAANDGVVHFSGLGSDASSLMVLEPGDANDESLASQVLDCDVVYFTGGSPDHLLLTLKGSKLLTNLYSALERGTVVGGSSAGAMVMGSRMRRPRVGEWVDALGIAPGLAVLPHHERSDPAVVCRELADSAPQGMVFLGIDAQSGCFGRLGSWQTVGPGKVTLYKDGAWEVFSEGEALPPGI